MTDEEYQIIKLTPCMQFLYKFNIYSLGVLLLNTIARLEIGMECHTVRYSANYKKTALDRGQTDCI